MTATDLLGRPLKNLRLSVTDRCNLRCSYCMPEAEYVWLPRQDLLQYEEMSALIDVFSRAGVDKIRITGGEPLLRRDLPQLVEMIARKPAIRDLALTTNGVALADQAKALREAGLHRITVSLDTLQPERFQALTRVDALPQVLAGIEEARRHFSDLKIDAVIIRGTNDDEVVPLLEYARRIGAELRFIEYMDVGGATQWSPERVLSREQMLARLRRQYGPITEVAEATSAPADRFTLPGRNRLRDHFLHHGPVLPKLRSQPADRGRDVVSVPVRDVGHGPADAAARREIHRTSCWPSSRQAGKRAPTVARKSVSRCGIARRWSRPAA